MSVLDGGDCVQCGRETNDGNDFYRCISGCSRDLCGECTARDGSTKDGDTAHYLALLDAIIAKDATAVDDALRSSGLEDLNRPVRLQSAGVMNIAHSIYCQRQHNTGAPVDNIEAALF